MVSGIAKILKDNSNDFDGKKWLTIGHDIWNTVVMDGALGSCIRIMTKDMEVYNIAAVLRKHNVSHCADEVGDVLEEVYQTRYGISLKKECSHVGSDTTPSARNVAANLDAVQVRLSTIFCCIVTLLHVY